MTKALLNALGVRQVNLYILCKKNRNILLFFKCSRGSTEAVQ